MNIFEKTAAFLRGGQSSDRPGVRRGFWAVNICALVIWSIGLGIVGLYFASAAVNHGFALFASYAHSAALMALNILPGLLLAFIFWFIFNRVWCGVLGSGLIVLGGSLVNYYKIMLRNDPLLAADLGLVSEAANMTGEYTLRITAAVLLTVICFIAAVLLSAFFLKARFGCIQARVGLLLAFLLACGVMIDKVYFDDRLYTSLENIERSAWFLSRWSDRDQYICRGFIYPFLHSVKTAYEKAPDGYSAPESRAYLESFGSDDIPEDKRVNIIAVMLEAYNDFSDFGLLDFTTDPYEYMHKLMGESISGHLVTNIFAGGTIDTERSFITGFTYMSQYRHDIPTYASYMASQGYTVEGGHPGYDWFYNRRNVERWFGFDNYYFFEDRYETHDGSLMMDKPFFEDILSLYRDNRSTGRPYFNFSVTYQNHGPYSDDQLYDSKTEYVRDKGYSKGAYNILNNYFWGIKKTDEAIEELIETLRNDEEPVIVILFGDHQPWLGDGSYVYGEMGISLDRGDEKGFYNYYSTPYVIWANDSARAVTGGSFTGDGGSFSPCFLMNRVFSECGWGGNSYMKASNRLESYVDVVNRSGVFRTSGGELTTALEGEALEEYRTFKRLEYFMKNDY